jgi:hypothetical protein
MAGFDIIIRNGTVATSVDSTLCSVGVRDGKIAALGAVSGLRRARSTPRASWCFPAASTAIATSSGRAPTAPHER